MFESYGRTYQGDPHSSHPPDTYSNFSILPVICSSIIGRYFNYCDKMDQNNRIRVYYLELDKYPVKECGYIRLEITVGLGIGITYTKILLSHDISDKISKIKLK